MKKNFKKCAAMLMAASLMMTGCGSDAYASYSTAYNKVSENGGIDANIAMVVTMDGKTTNSNGSFKLDTANGNNNLYYEMNVGDSKITQFSDGKYLYTDSNGEKTKFALNVKPAGGSNKAEQKESTVSFDSGAFLSEFSSCLEAGKIKEMGLLSPIQKSSIKNISEKDGVYTLEFSDSIVQTYLNTLIASETKQTDGDSLRIDEMKDFTYTATVKNNVVTEVTYGGNIIVNVPASLTTSGANQSYDMNFNIKVTYNNPGTAVTVTVPDTDGYNEIS